MRVLLVQDNEDLGRIWCKFLNMQGLDAQLVTSPDAAIEVLQTEAFDAMVLEPVLEEGSSIAIADFATYKNPDIAILAVTKSSFFSDGSVFEVLPNARGLLRTPIRPDDLVAYLEHFAPRRGASSSKQRA